MSTIYKTIPGDTFESISRKKYGTEENASLIAKSNPGLKQPFISGISIGIPAQVGAPQNIPQKSESDNQDEVSLSIKGKRFRFWDAIRITRRIDGIDTIDFSSPFDSTIPGFKENFEPFSFNDASFSVGGDPLFTGTIIPIDPVVENKKKIVTVSGYSLPGVLNDCTIPASAEVEFNNQGLIQISKTIASLFGLTVDFSAEQGAIFERVAIDQTKKVLEFLTGLANQRNLISSSTREGKLLFSKPIEKEKPIAILKQGESPLLSVIPLFNPQEYYSHITGIEPVILGLKGSQFTVKNPFLQGVTRPFTFVVPDTEDATMKEAVDSKMGRMFANMASYNIAVDTWRDPAGNIWEPNKIINLTAPDAMIYNPYDFLIRSVEFERTSTAEIAVLNLIIPGTLSGKMPGSLPWAV